ncbi:pseudaminic acid synthase [Acetobacterium bakii]|uniref:N-acetylneuraminate synthase n=1 Tax=Acetobacterium bakii TaxID=52689 RepID=A0A0L6U2T2_9FIRM|nr:pseudaminic acid synthase [Acetobacterium bakii]KNZ42662.1 N-acetylneuraminate synthase [Acetobacterium bakii]
MNISDFDFNSEKTFIIGELSANHNGSLDVALKTIRALKDIGADAVKIQTYTPDTITLDCNNSYFRITQGTIWDGTTLHQLYQTAFTPWEWHSQIFEVAKEQGLICFSSPFDKTAVDFLEELDVPAYKIASFEITDTNLIEYAASKGKPMIISTGIATIGEIQEAVNICKRVGNEQIILLKCTSVYPSPKESINLRTIPNLKETFNVISGLSDHTLGISIPIAAVALGARVIEKHVILDKSIGGPDSSFSLEISEFKQMVDSIREVEKAMGTVSYDLDLKSLKSREHVRSLFFAQDMERGEVINEENVRSVRPGFGLEPKYFNDILGKKIVKAVKKGTPVAWKLVEL